VDRIAIVKGRFTSIQRSAMVCKVIASRASASRAADFAALR
jgi:hypothetical protein